MPLPSSSSAGGALLSAEILYRDDIEVVVLEVRGEQVRVGIRAPKNVSVHRKEIYEQIQTDVPDGSKPAEAG